MFGKSFDRGVWVLAALLMLWAGAAAAGDAARAAHGVSLAGGAADSAPTVHAAVDAEGVSAAHQAGSDCDDECVSGCASACGHGAVMHGIALPDGVRFADSLAQHTYTPPTEAVEDAEPRPPRLLHQS